MARAAVLILACRDYEALELSLACHAAYAAKDVPIYILQNCRGNYDAERTLAVAKRYARLFPRTIKLIDGNSPTTPYRAIAAVLNSREFSPYELVCKVDDDAFPIQAGWLDTLLQTWHSAAALRSEDRPLGYVTPLINNNTWGFEESLNIILGLREEYLREAAIEHLAGQETDGLPCRVLPPEEIETGANGTVWGYPHIARWLHSHTTLQPEKFIAATKDLSPKDVPNADRYSIGCILFQKKLWSDIDDGGIDDEHMWHQYAKRTNSRIVCARSVPFVHLAYFSQREENRDIVETARSVYQPRLGHPFPIAMYANRLLEIEARLRWMEGQRLRPSSAAQQARASYIRRALDFLKGRAR